MSNRKKRKNIKENLPTAQDWHQQIAEAVDGLTYMSETDAEILPFSGREEDFLSREFLLLSKGDRGNIKIEEKDFNEFFAPLIKIQDWFGEDERKMTGKFAALKELLQQNLRDLKVFRIGKKEIEIFVVGLDSENVVRGIQTRAVET